MAEQRSELLIMKQALKDEIVSELREQLKELVAGEARQRLQRYTKLHQKQRRMLKDSDTSSTSPQPAKCTQEENKQILSNVDTDDDTSSSIHQSEEEQISSYSFHSTFSSSKEEEDVLMERQWKEWMDQQENIANPFKVKPAEQQHTENQGGEAPCASERQTKQEVKEAGTMMKIRMYLGKLFAPETSYKWNRLEEEEEED